MIKLMTFVFSLTVTLLHAEPVQPADAKFVTLAPHIVENLYAVGAGQQIIGATEHSDYPLIANQIPRIGNYAGISIEKVLALQPDYIIAWRNGNPPADLKRMQELGLKIMYSTPKVPEDIAKELIWLGHLSGHTQTAKNKAKIVLDTLSWLNTKYQQPEKPIKVFYQVWSSPLTTAANNAWPHQLLKVCGVENVFSEQIGDYPQISAEHVLLKNPDVIIIPTSASEPNGDKSMWQKYPQLNAVKNERIIYVNSDKLHRMTGRAIDELAIMCEKIHLSKQN
ncbi:cobalamin-binding protein [Gayadomonas joobiniege]|uniref:cobalamin-binding protein n=1 Tax=Gayadomonas joobiniege TaxID=1234606 RepID=UPI0012DC34EA|nr:cobalamin-binding protein [Gayadomonas joobiniege]